eukprot:scaffold235166_cov18-Prasinocladus_malaysianus.AAC.1
MERNVVHSYTTNMTQFHHSRRLDCRAGDRMHKRHGNNTLKMPFIHSSPSRRPWHALPAVRPPCAGPPSRPLPNPSRLDALIIHGGH